MNHNSIIFGTFKICIKFKKNGMICILELIIVNPYVMFHMIKLWAGQLDWVPETRHACTAAWEDHGWVPN